MRAVLLVLLLLAAACGAPGDPRPPEKESPVANAPEPERITVQHVLISFGGAGTSATRTKEAAEKLAQETLARAKKGEDFGKLVSELSDDADPGIYGMCNRGQQPRSKDEYPRDGMVPAFGNVGFKLPVGGIDMAGFDARTSPYGWHIIKRIR